MKVLPLILQSKFLPHMFEIASNEQAKRQIESLSLLLPLSLTSSWQNFFIKGNKSSQFRLYALSCLTLLEAISFLVKRYLIQFLARGRHRPTFVYRSEESCGN